MRGRLEVAGGSRRYHSARHIRATRRHDVAVYFDRLIERRLKRVAAPVSCRTHRVDQTDVDRRSVLNADGFLAMGQPGEQARITIVRSLGIVR
ncbi:MAG: hypothetical protein DMG24_02820 [Acidobacteria bacterium]|nr:MAG: hypothetical protein DMG24_02820 [Acidobacteriota bacterium]